MSRMYGNYGSVQPSKAGHQQREHGMLKCTNCLISVPQDQFYAVERFGQYDKIVGSGLHCLGCDCCGVCIGLRSISRRVEQNESIIETKTKDNVFVLVRVAVQQSVIPDRAEQAVYRLVNVATQVDSYVADVVRSHVPRMPLDEVFENKDAISIAIQEQLEKHMTEYGFTIHKALVTEIRPSQEIVDSMNEINKQTRLRDAAVMSAEADRVRTVVKAQAEAEGARLRGVGTAQQRGAIIEGLKKSIDGDAGEKMRSDRVAELLLITQYFETIRAIGATAKGSSIFMPHSPGDAVADIAKQIRSGIMRATPEEMAQT